MERTSLDAPSHFTVVDFPGWISSGHSVNAKPWTIAASWEKQAPKARTVLEKCIVSDVEDGN